VKVAALGLMLAVAAVPAAAQEPVRLFAAGSLRSALTEVARSFQAEAGIPVATTFGPSGLLRERIEKGEAAEVFASADMGHPQRLAAAGRAAPVALFARNRLCALAAPRVAVTGDSLLERMLDPALKLGMSTPKADPSGDYAVQLYAKAEKVRPGAQAVLEKKALRLTGGPDSPPPPKDRNVYGMLVERGDADVFLTYCTNALEAKREVPSLAVVQVPEALAVGADYGLTLVKGARPEAERFARYVLQAPGQAILSKYGFSPGDAR
jgi:ABC-type molybdate transport system substrate-binding protein